MSAQAEQWRVSTIEGIFETDLETLKQWIVEGCILPTDKVCKGSLSWIEAGRAPLLRAAFRGEYKPALPPTTVVTGPEAHTPPSIEAADADEGFTAFDEEESQSQNFAAPRLDNACHNHPNVSPKYSCRVCGTPFCEECPRYIGTTRIPVCSLCGDMCKPYEEVRAKTQRQDFQSSGFGFADFSRALKYPLQHKGALLFGAAVYGFLQLAGLRGRVIAFVIMFGCISHVISQVAWGKLHRSFLPDFSAFSMWDDLAVPIGLGLGIIIVTWGPAIAFALALVFGIINGPEMSAANNPLAPAGQTRPLTPEELGQLVNPETDPKKLEELNQRLYRTSAPGQIAEQAEKSKQELSDPTRELRTLFKYFQLPVALVLLLLISIAWGIFYWPMALSVAGYTEHFGSVINPLVGLDTIRRMGLTYFKAFGMVIMLQIAALILSVIVAAITSPFTMPFFGNLPANFIDGSFTFYFNLVIACVLGLSLHKCADRLGIDVKA
jgi:hypothetical protein